MRSYRHVVFLMCVLAVTGRAFAGERQDPKTADEGNERIRRRITLPGKAPVASARPATPAEPSAMRIAVIRLKHARAEEMAPLLTRACMSIPYDVEPHIGADARTNALVITADAAGVEMIGRAVEELDCPAPSPSPDAKTDDVERRLRVSATIYRVMLAEDKVDSVSAEALTAAAGARSSFNEFLASFGASRVLFQTHQILANDGAGRETQIGVQTPCVVGSTTTKSGAVVNNVQYESVGMLVEGAGELTSMSLGRANVKVEFEDLDESDVALGNGVNAPVMRTWKQSFNGPFKVGEPIILFAVDTQTSAAPTLYVLWLRFDAEAIR
ncbi:MAG TPA: secretin N-terminal domain-containing protein [Phycisphaerae bacterium]|nr:secretin N-terminal domain-containing protein [Phycisphaerae bacterium]HRW53542.1 secretin N-terminal domain-containing protein [Phycisphaerae bacterium]